VSEGPAFDIRPMEQDRLVELLQLRWPDRTMLVAGRFVEPEDVEGIGAFTGDRLHGIATWLANGRVMHIVAVNSFTELRGIGVALVDAMMAEGRARGMAILRASISNDNVIALRFYQKRGFRLSALHRGIFDAMRQVRPSIPLTGLDSIPLRDELELEHEL
jgi:ribosomal protein S18 acetylase RimI-like enzyme